MSLFKASSAIAMLIVSTQASLAAPTQVRDVDNVDLAPFQEQVYTPSCQSYNWCSVTFSAVPAGKRLVVDHVSCLANASKIEPTAAYSVALTGSTGVDWFFADRRGYSVILNAQTHWIAEEGAKPAISINETTSKLSKMICMLSGHYVAL